MKKKMIYFFLLFLVLFLTRLMDISILHSLGEKEDFFLSFMDNIDYSRDTDIYNENIGFSSYESAEKELLKKVEEEEDDRVIVLSYFDFICPTRYLIFNKDKKRRVTFPWVSIEAEQGLTEISLYKFEYITIKTNTKAYGFFYPVVGFPYDMLYEKKTKIPGEEDDKGADFDLNFNSFHPPTFYFENSLYIREIYFFYFFPPLLIILLLLRKHKIHLAYLYFIFMPFLFNPKYFMFFAPSLGLTDPIGGKPLIIQSIIPFIITILFGVFFIRNIKNGIKAVREKTLKLEEKFITLYFLLLPFFLRF